MAKLNTFHADCKTVLDACWQRVQQHNDLLIDVLPDFAPDIRSLTRAPRGISSSFRFVLPTQLVAKLANDALDCRSLQLRAADGHTFNARDVAKHVIVPFNRENGSPLGASGDPYVNNPLRLPALSPQFREQQADKGRWDMLCRITVAVEEKHNPEFTQSLLAQTLLETRRLIEELTVEYIVPQRISHSLLLSRIAEYLSPRTGGRRLQTVCVALLRAVGEHWGI